ncbi:DUF1015 family protein [Candidatus Venteria ishoeyi]|uniref:DUF1015 domain-containing protein n=1 Tax=Candidatus Venteria ishoeyi TaxID=1899563 RepID=UPI0025A5803E|nr:DUF1015 family protein [Candidatus Venteria ishoeyi]MDM8545182.1 DUF1015 family protein [Candidatus Venteria ishoeyi]
MSLIRPFAGLRPTPEYTEAVVAPPYDVLNTEEARQRAAGRPWSFLHISRPEIDLAKGISPYDPAVYAKGAENLQKMIAQGVLKQDAKSLYYLYELVMDDHSQIGLVAAASVVDYDSNRIRKHEFTRPDKEDDRVRQIDTLDAQTGPVLLTYKQDDTIQGLIDQLTSSTPIVDVTADDGIIHRLWLVEEDTHIQTITDTFDAMPALYIADGHHRSASASRVAKMRNGEQAPQDNAHDYFLVVMFPDTRMKILDYNRVIKDLNDLDETSFLQRVEENFQVQLETEPFKPSHPGEFGMYLNDRWYRLDIHSQCIPKDDPVARLDVSLLSDYLIAPILGITDPRRDKRIDFVGGIRGLEGLQARVDSGEMKLAFSLFPTRMSDLMDVADANQVMPPKSTWFEPKLADGLVSHILD